MEQAQDRWRRPVVRLAVVALVGITIYFLVIFVKQSLIWYQLRQDERAQEARVTQLAEQNEALEKRLGRFMEEEGRRLLVEQNLPYVGEGERVAVPVAAGAQNPAVVPLAAGDSEEVLAALPAWQQWVRVIFTPMAP
jgi:hypothetical protein